MQIAVKGLTNDYAQYMRDKTKNMTYEVHSLRKLNNGDLQKTIAGMQAKAASAQKLGLGEILKQQDGTKLNIAATILEWQYTLDTMGKQGQMYPATISEMGKRNTLDTPFGEMKVAIKVSDDVNVYLDQLSQLTNFDVNNDGFVDSSDINAKNLVLVGYDEDGNEIEINLLETMGKIDITQFFDYQPNAFQSDYYLGESSYFKNESEAARKAYHHASQYDMGLATKFRPEESHKQLKSENVTEFFKAYADKSGWIDFTNLDTFTKIFGDKGLDLSYRKTGADGSTRLERINFYTNIREMRETQEKGERFFAWEYKAAQALKGGNKSGLQLGTPENLRYQLQNVISKISTTDMNAATRTANELAHQFYELTGLNYSQSSFEKVKEGLESGKTEFFESLNDSTGEFNNYLVGMHLNEDSGKITMLFSSGKEVEIAIEDLYSGNGELSVDEFGNRASIMNEAREMSQEDLNNLDFSKVGAIFDDTGVVRSLKDWGITAIQKATYSDGRFLSFVLSNAEGMKFTAQDLYNLSFISNGGLDSSHKADSNQESKTAFANAEDKDSNSMTTRMRKVSNPIVFPTNPHVDMRI